MADTTHGADKGGFRQMCQNPYLLGVASVSLSMLILLLHGIDKGDSFQHWVGSYLDMTKEYYNPLRRTTMN